LGRTRRGIKKAMINKQKMVFGVGINDANYPVKKETENKIWRCPFYSRWAGMLCRCYNKAYQEKFKTYSGCYVCDDWLLFSNFRSWMINKNWKGMDLDKDIIRPGNKYYHPDFCAFIDPSLNKLLNELLSPKGAYPKGVSKDKNTESFRSRVRFNGKRIGLGSYKNIKDASNVYVLAKIEIILLAAKYHVDKRVSDGLEIHAESLKKTLFKN